ncbi:10998_t:CDS:2 [Gigaspora rosea]|nr:10998_t:CDS:2 [Gigaspora rosea]
MAELREKLSEFIGFKPDEICFPETEKNQQLFRKIIADQRMATNIVIDDFHFLLCTGYNECEKVLLKIPHNITNKIITHLQYKFKDIPLAPIVRYPNILSQLDSECDII